MRDTFFKSMAYKAVPLYNTQKESKLSGGGILFLQKHRVGLY